MSSVQSGGKSGSRSGSSISENVWKPQGQALTDMYGEQGDLYNQTNSTMSSLIPGAVDQQQDITSALVPEWQNQMQGGSYANMDLQDTLMESLNNSMNNPSATQEINSLIMGGDGNNYADAMKDQYIQDANSATDNMLANLDARAVASGMSGGSRHGTATAKGLEDINRNLQSNLATTGYNTFDNDLDRKLQIAGQADSNTLQREGMLSTMLSQMQDTINTGVNNTGMVAESSMDQFAPVNAPWSAANNYAQNLGNPTTLGSGSANSSSKSSGGRK